MSAGLFWLAKMKRRIWRIEADDLKLMKVKWQLRLWWRMRLKRCENGGES